MLISLKSGQNESYYIHVGCEWESELRNFLKDRKYIVICDEIFFGILDFLNIIYIPAGESAKTRETKSLLEDQLMELKADKKTVLVAVGGGSIGDLVGFVASTLYRGVSFIQIPTTLLAMVDASVGGKTAVNHPKGKNLIGAFHQPLAVFVDFRFLDTLSARDFASGMAEIVKAGIAGDALLWQTLSALNEKRPSGDELTKLVSLAIEYKARIVCEDERDLGARNELNFGHTIGHALEALEQNVYTHGECVAIGIVLELMALRAINHLEDEGLVFTAAAMLSKFGLPTYLSPVVSLDEFIANLLMDKKNTLTALIPVVAVKRIGLALGSTRTIGVPLGTILRIVAPYVEVFPSFPSSSVREMRLPGSKSIANRVLLLSALADQSTTLSNVPGSDDVRIMVKAIEVLGLATISVSADQIIVTPIKQQHTQSDKHVFVGNSGTTARFLLPIASLLVSTGKLNSVEFFSEPRMAQRPIDPLVDALKEAFNNTDILRSSISISDEKVSWLKISRNDKFFVPKKKISIQPNLSSQYVSALLMMVRMYPIPLEVMYDKSSLVSEPFVAMTQKLIALWQAGVNVYSIPGDAAAASYPLAIAALTGESVRVNIGKSDGDLQSDYAFITLLESWGCRVEHDQVGTVLTGPIDPKLIPSRIDMNSYSDTFLTAAVVIAHAGAECTITNIANQRVKECNRIGVMVDNLKSCGYNVEETDDGIFLKSSDKANLRETCLVHTFNDHRVAMAMATLGTVHTGISIENPRCVEKTFPTFWDVMSSDLGYRIVGQDCHSVLPTLTSICLIGMRGIGKSTLGRLLAESIGWDFIDLDEYIVESTGSSIAELIETNGWAGFRLIERNAFAKIIRQNLIIATGGGTVEAENAGELFEKCHTIWIRSDEETTIARAIISANESVHSVKFPDPVEQVYARRKKRYEEFSQYDLFVGDIDQSLKVLKRMVLVLTAQKKFENTGLSNSTFACLTAPSYTDWTALDFTRAIGLNDLVEIRVDCLDGRLDFCESVAMAMNQINLPIILTYRTAQEGGQGEASNYWNIVRKCIRLIPDWIDIEIRRVTDSEASTSLRNQKIKFISSLHLPLETIPRNSQILKKIINSVLAPKWSRMGKIVFGYSDSLIDSARFAVMAADTEKPCIAICMSESGLLTRILNIGFTPVAASALCGPAGPGQVSLEHLRALQTQLHPETQYHLFGSPVDKSPSSLLHNTMFAAKHVRAKYTAIPATCVSELLPYLAAHHFRGASVTMPLKEQVFDALSSRELGFTNYRVSEEAKQAKSVNTLSLKGDLLEGHNTDIIALEIAIDKILKTSIPIEAITIVGTGGAARGAIVAAQKFNLPIHIVGRNLGKVKDLADEFSINPGGPTRMDASILIACVPSAAQEDLLSQFPSLISPSTWVIEMAYIPRETPFIRKSSFAVYGSEILILQAIEQNKLWSSSSDRKIQYDDLAPMLENH